MTTDYSATGAMILFRMTVSDAWFSSRIRVWLVVLMHLYLLLLLRYLHNATHP